MENEVTANQEVTKKKGKGQPPGSTNIGEPSPDTFESTTRSGKIKVTVTECQSQTYEDPTLPIPSGSKSTRMKIYLIDHSSDKLPSGKLPKNIHILQRFFNLEKENSIGLKQAANIIMNELREVWAKHFGDQLVYGRKIGAVEDQGK